MTCTALHALYCTAFIASADQTPQCLAIPHRYINGVIAVHAMEWAKKGAQRRGRPVQGTATSKRSEPLLMLLQRVKDEWARAWSRGYTAQEEAALSDKLQVYVTTMLHRMTAGLGQQR